MNAADGGTPPKTDDTILKVIVDRNLYRPRFNDSVLLLQIYENQPPGDIFKEISAYDLDSKVGHMNDIRGQNSS